MVKKIGEKLDFIKSKYGKVDELTVSSFNKQVDLIIMEFESIQGVPKLIISRSVYTKVYSDEIETVRLIIRPSIQYKMGINENKDLVILRNSPKIYIQLIDSIYSWIEKYYIFLEYDLILQDFNVVISDILEEIDSPYSVSFVNGSSIIEEIRDNKIVIGLTLDKIQHLKELDIFSTDSYWSNKYKENLKKFFKSCTMPYDIVKSKNSFTETLGIYTRKSIYKLLRRTVNRRLSNVRVGVGYIETSDYFSIIEKRAFNTNDLLDYPDKSNILILDNEQATIKEKSKGQDKIIVSFLLSPIEKKSGVILNIGLEEVLSKGDVINV